MGKILCATRGGEASYRTQDQAIELARQRGDEVLFLYVVNIDFLNKTAAPIVVDVATEIEHLGGFLLAMACEWAQKQGVGATFIVRHGKLRDELKAVAREQAVDLVVLGQPAGAGGAFVPADLEAFAAEIEAETGVEVMIV